MDLVVRVAIFYSLFLLILFYRDICSLLAFRFMGRVGLNKRVLNLLTRKDGKLEVIFEELKIRAAMMGFALVPSEIRLVRYCISTYFEGLAFFYDQNESDTHFVFIFSRSYRNLSDAELKFVIAHEIGHLIDCHSKRCGHPLLTKARHLDQEGFADFTAKLLVSKDIHIKFGEKHNYITA